MKIITIIIFLEMKIITTFGKKSGFAQEDCRGKKHPQNIHIGHMPKESTCHSQGQMIQKLAFKWAE